MPDQPVKPLVLALDTTHAAGSLALARAGEVIEEVTMESPTGFAHVLYGHLERLLERHRIRVDDVDCFAAASGPGSFTGVRVGLACIKGLAEAAGKRAAGVSNLQALSCFGSAALRAVVMDARRGEVYGAVYDAAARVVMPEVVTPLERWLESLPAGDIQFILGHGAQLPLPPGARVTCAPLPISGAVARLAAAQWLRGEPQDPAPLDANYVRRSDAELYWRE